jgi:glutamate carboxypeptidase
VVDVRAPTEEHLTAAEREIRSICSTAVVDDVTLELHENGWHRPMEPSAASERLVRLAIGAAGDLGFGLRDAATGGASDANTTSAAGLPTIDGLGPVGGDDHAPGEWIDVTTIVPRVALLACVLTRLRDL